MSLPPIAHSRPWLTPGDHQAVACLLESEWLASGTRCRAFETRLADWVGAPRPGAAVASGSAALVLALAALGAGTGDEVILPTYVCPSVLDAVVAVGAEPVVCDVGPGWVVEAAAVAPHVTRHTRAIVVPHVYGIRAEVEAIRGLGVPVIEDRAQALDAEGAHPIAGDLAVFSFHPTKCLTTGEGGMAIARDPGLAERLLRVRDGAPDRRQARVIAPLSDLAAALGLAQLGRYPKALTRRHAIAGDYRAAIGGVAPQALARQAPSRTMWFRFPISVPGGLAACGAAFAEAGVTVRRGVDQLVHRLLGLDDRAFPVARELFDTTVSLPLYPALTSGETARVSGAARLVLPAVPGLEARCA
ncbi:MAG: DegT/DnrJ/EryC1/StrS family aminotransferase [Vicinamibacterales bacterium]